MPTKLEIHGRKGEAEFRLNSTTKRFRRFISKKHKKLLDIYLFSNGSTNQSVKVRYDRAFERDMFDGYVAEVYATGVFTQQIELLDKQGWYCSYILATEKNQIYFQLFHRKAKV